MAELHKNLSIASSHVRLRRISEGNFIDEPFSVSEPSDIVFKNQKVEMPCPVSGGMKCSKLELLNMQLKLSNITSHMPFIGTA